MVNVKVGDRIPDNLCLGVMNKDDKEPKQITTKEIFKGKKVILVGIPGAFTSICSSKHIPDYVSRYSELKAKGVEQIVCIAVNDPFVMREWAYSLKTDDKILMVSDGETKFHSALGLTQHLPYAGIRGLRFSMFVDDGVIKVLNVDEPGPLSYKISGPEHMLKDLEKLGKQ
nr:9319_t:CDS:2 [Entrophospora candida]